MKNIKVLGTGCANCKTTQKLIEEAAKEKGIDIELEKVEDIAEIMSFGVMSTPGVVVDGKLVHAGGIPDRATIDTWLAESENTSCCGGGSASDSGGGCCG